MPDLSTFALFAAACLAFLAIPGPSVFYIVTRSLAQGRRAGVTSMLGVQVGGLVHVVGAAVGVSALIASSAAAFTVVKYAGAAYLVYLGVRRLLTAGTREAEPGPDDRATTTRLFWQGVVVNLLNPKTALFFLAFLPQFVDPDAAAPALQIFALGMIFVAIALCSDSIWALAAGTLGGWLRRSRWYLGVKRWVTGTVFVALGLSATRA